ncbi:hypothetical protein ACHAQI_009129 [Fusarium lateritium]
MFPRSVDALKTARAVSGRPSLLRFLQTAKKKTNPGAERVWPTGPAMKDEKIPIRTKYQPSPSEFPIPVSVFMVPNNSTAYIRWPKLKYFRPTLQPRAWKTIRPGGDKPITHGEQIMCLPYVYHDLGIMIYEGPDKDQTETIANTIKRVVGHEGRLQYRDWTLPAFVKKGILHPRGLHELSETAIKRWETDWKATMKAEGLTTYMQIEAINSSKQMFLLTHKESCGQTINGPRQTQVDAYVATATYKDTILMDIELHTVGTKRFLGSFNVRFRKRDFVPDTIESKILSEVRRDGSSQKEKPIIPGNEKRKRISPEDVTEIRNLYAKYAPSSATRYKLTAPEVARTVWKLEQKLWAQRKKTVAKIEKEKRQARKQRKVARKILSEAEEKEEQEDAEKEAQEN